MRIPIPILFLFLPALLGAQSPMFRGDASHTGTCPAPAHPLKGKVAWSFEAMAWKLYAPLKGMDGRQPNPTTPAVVDGVLFSCAGPYVFALDAEGRLLWRTRLGAVTFSSPAVAGGVAYVPDDDGVIHALDAKSGAERWARKIGSPTDLKQLDYWDVYQSSPAVDGPALYVGTADGAVTALALADGAVQWRYESGAVVRATPAVAGGRVYAANIKGRVFCLDAATGKLVWDLETRLPDVPWHTIQGSCAVAGGVVYVGSRNTFTYALDAATGTVKWRYSHEGSWVPSTPAVRDGVAYVGQSDGGKVTALGADGKARWVYETGKSNFSSPTLAGDTLYVGSNDNYDQNGKGSLAAVDIATGKARWTLELPGSVWAAPVIAGETAYVACSDGKVYAVR
jgi:outer membrane protein assembly factor BamB